MRAGFVLIIFGVVMLVSGLVFFLQGNSIVGPSTSFMYSNPQWIVYGGWLAIGGAVILLAGTLISLRHLRL